MPLLILIAEDDPGIRLAVNDYLEMSGYSTIMAENGEQALLMMEKYHPHLLISDIKMPKRDGYQLVKEIRQRPEFRLLPVIFLTEYGSKKERIMGYQAGCDIYLPKPFEMDELEAVIRNLLEKSQMIHSEIRFSSRKNDAASSPVNQENYSQLKDLVKSLELTSREQEVLVLVAKGSSNIDIGHHLHLSPRTIEKYVSSLLRKTETSNRAELIHFAWEHHLLE
ncbi:MAG: response regulator transcription factor [Xenococcaceae cyanobacterium MO_167.B52]|nr:response regulator transcription factor [Xenococcaceae cyanobacterium MO_167.B52]